MNASSTPLVSVIIPTYNMGAYVGDAIRSVQNQTFRDLEIHVVDDGSTDDTRAAVAPLLADPRVHYHHQENKGKSVAKNVGIRASRGKYIGFSDADDLWLPNKLELQLPAFEHSPAVGVVYSRSQRINAAGTLLEPHVMPEPSGRVTEALFYENFVPFGTAMIRADALQAHGGFNENYRMGMDWEIFLRLSVHYEFACVPAVTYLYRIWEGQMSSNWAGRYKNAFQIMDEFLAANPGAVSRAVVRRSIAASYANRGRARANISADYSGAMRDALIAVQKGYNPIYASRLLIRCALRVVGLAHGPLDAPPKAQQ